jgi:hypothetical protein
VTAEIRGWLDTYSQPKGTAIGKVAQLEKEKADALKQVAELRAQLMQVQGKRKTA